MQDRRPGEEHVDDPFVRDAGRPVGLEDEAHRRPARRRRCTFDNLLSKVVRLQSADAVAAESMAEPVFSELNQLTARVAALEVSLSETLQLRGAV